MYIFLVNLKDIRIYFNHLKTSEIITNSFYFTTLEALEILL